MTTSRAASGSRGAVRRNLGTASALSWGLLILLLSACRPSAEGRSDSIILAGSTSVQPFAELLAEEYARQHPEAPVINIQGGGSTAGVQAALTHTADIGMSSRLLKESEEAQGLVTQPIAYDAIAVVAHLSNPVDGLTSEQVRRIFTGDIRNWREVGGEDRAIVVITREEGSGTRGAFEEILMGEAMITDLALRQDSNGAVRVIVNSDPAAIGYMSLGIVGDLVKPLALDGVYPTVQAAVGGEYFLVRPFLFLWLGQLSPPAREFVEFVLFPEAQALLAGEGLIPVPET